MRSRATVLIDEFLPRFDAVERHRTRVRAPAALVYAAIRTADLAASPVVRLLLALRALPAALESPATGLATLRAQARRRVTLDDLAAGGFALLGEDPPRELVLGLEGRFWTARGGLCAVTAQRFGQPIAAGTARAAWDFRVEPRADGTIELSTETRVRCADAAAVRRFRVYWLVVRPWSGAIRRLMLASIRREAEAATA